MEMHQLRYVIAIARVGNFSRAAEQCHVAQPSLSQQVRKLEDELGERLFERKKREATLTPHGEAFLPRAIRILEEVEAARREANDAKNLLRGAVTIGGLPTIAPYLLPPVMGTFMKRFPGLEIIVSEDTTEKLLQKLAGFEIDFAVVSLPIQDPRVEMKRLFSEELLLALPPQHRLTRRKVVAAEDLESELVIVMKEGHCLADQVLGFCGRHDLHTAISFRSSQLETIRAFVRAGMGISLIPAMAIRKGERNSPVYRKLKPALRREIVALWPRRHALSRAASELLKTIETHVSRNF
jgi:LysR family hydrogen peroxide-inducible transcriptional activator